MGKPVRINIPTVTAVLFTVAMLTFTLMWFRGNVNSLIEDSTEKYLSENTRALAAVFRTKLDDQLIMLESQKRYFEDIDLTDYNAMKNTIMATKGIGAFKTIGVANQAGTTINYNGHTSGNILLSDYFQEAMQGSTAISESTITDETGSEVLVAAVPIMRNGRSVGTVFGTFDKSTLSELLNNVSFSGRETNILLRDDGSVLAVSQTDIVDSKMTNLFDEINFYTPSSNKDTVLSTNIDGTDVIVVFTPVGVHEWYFASILPDAVVDEQSAVISGNVAIVIIVVSFAFILLFVSILYLLKSNEVIARTSEKFKMVSVQSQDIIIDYDFTRRILTLDGNTDNVVKDGKNTFNYSETMELLGLVHSDDEGMREQLADIRSSSDTSVRGEFRMRCLDGTYSWFKLKATIVRVHDHPQQMVGSLINVDEQMNKELRLIEKAETDPLTGILNKGAFREHVSERLKDASRNDLFAVYIIDLDNFKAVNDNLGHAMGDQVLSDVAKKLCIVFSDQDCVGRIGGDEFAAFLRLSSNVREKGMNIIESKAKAICSHMQETYHARKKSVSVSSSVGVAIYPNAGRDYDTLYKNADKALYSIKENGKNGYSIYSPEQHDKNQPDRTDDEDR